MKISIRWRQPVALRQGRRDENLIYACDKLNAIRQKPGIYVFARRYGGQTVPIYVGQAVGLRGRIKSQLNNMGLMMGIRSMQNCKRIVLVGEFVPAPGQPVDVALDVMERAYIEHALTAGYELLNKQGVRTPVHVITSRGKRSSYQPFPRRVAYKKTRKTQRKR